MDHATITDGISTIEVRLANCAWRPQGHQWFAAGSTQGTTQAQRLDWRGHVVPKTKRQETMEGTYDTHRSWAMHVL
jgi:hypothetical protein